MPASNPELVQRRLEEFRRNLLDTSLRNRLIHFRVRTKAGKALEKVVEVYGEDPVELVRILVTEGKAMSFVGRPDPRPPKAGQPSLDEVDDYGDAASLERLKVEAEHELDTFVNTGQDLVDQTDLKLNTHDTVTALSRKLTKIHRDARVAVEEQGANVLFLALGSLVWFESADSEEERRAPLLLLPVVLERTNAGAFRLKWDGSDPGGNLSIAAKLKAEFNIRLPEIGDELDVKAYLTEVVGAVRSQPRWSVDRTAVALGFFSYAKYLMYRDLDAGGWPIDDLPFQHPTLGALLDSGFEDDEPGISEDAFLDPLRPVAEVGEVYDADGSQTLAILEANTGRTMLIEGPPGTGKSQTITNLIAEAVGAGKKVLFVAEKAAALDVVYRRLREANLEDACLELHSNKANKRGFYDRLKRTVGVAAPKVADAEQTLRRLEEARTALNGYEEALNTPIEGREVTPRFAMGRLVAIGPETSPVGRHDFAPMREWRQTEFEVRRDLVARLGEHLARMGRPGDHPFFGSTLEHLLPQDKADLSRLLDAASETTETLHLSANALAEALHVELPERPADVERLGEWVRFVIEAPDVRGVDVRGLSEPSVREAVRAGRRLNEIRAVVPAETLARDVSRLRELLSFGGSHPAPSPDGGGLGRGRSEGAFAGTPSPQPPPEGRGSHLLDEAADATFALLDASASLAKELGLPVPTSLDDMEPLTNVAKRASFAPQVRGAALVDGDWPSSGAVLKESLEALREYQELHARYGAVLTEAAWSADVAGDLTPIREHGGSFFRFFNGAYRAAMKRSEALFTAPPKAPADRAAALVAVLEARGAEETLARHRGRLTSLFGEQWQGVRSDATNLTEVASWATEMQAEAAAGRFPAAALRALERGSDPAALGRAADEVRRLLSATSEAIGRFPQELGADRVFAWLRDELRPALPELREIEDSVAAGSVPASGGQNAGTEPAATGFHADRYVRVLNQIDEAQRLLAWLQGSDLSALGLYAQADGSDWNVIERLLDWTVALRRSTEDGTLPNGLLNFFAEDRPREGLDSAVKQAQTDRETARAAVKRVLEAAQLPDDPAVFTEDPIAQQRGKIENWRTRLDDLPALIRYNALAAEAHRLSLDQTVELAESWAEAGTALLNAFERSWYTGLVREAAGQRPPLAAFDRASHEATVKEFQTLDDLALRINRARIALAHWRSVPRAGVGGAIGWLNIQFNLKLNHKPIRVAMAKAGEAIQAIKPVFLMSPLSVAMYLPADGPRFDVVIFDEASQVKPEDAFGGILRAAQTIVVGDSKQMPPTSFFDKLTSEEPIDDEDAADDGLASMKELESVLAMMSARIPAQSPRRRDLRWHYRSKHDGLIATSNRLFYDDRLVVFPSPERAGANAGLILRHDPSTVYGRGGSRKNVGEARTVALAAQRHVREHPNLTLGIAAFSQAQQEAIQDEIDALRKADPAFEAFDTAHPFEPLFVKNLENVQGDERDAIFISVGYGRDENGFIPASFGPLNRDGGERRLNVLITRARVRCEVFTNIRASDVRTGENPARGVLALKTFLAFAESGSLDVPSATGMEPQSPFEEAVLARLQAQGYAVEPQVGSCGFYIDLAVRHPDDPGRFVLGIECDGAMYHRARSARDRDKLRQAVLESRGWRIHRIWSTDWFQNPDRELDRLLKAVEAAIHVDDVEPVEASARPSEFVELERDASVTIEETIPAYEACELAIDLNGRALHELPTADLANWIVCVVEKESPIHREEAVRRVREAAEVGRAGTRIQAAIDAAIALAERDGRLLQRGDFLYLHSAEVPLRSRAAMAGKKLDLVAPEEIAVALAKVVRDSFGIAPDEAMTLTAKLLGFDRTTGAMTDRLRAVLDSEVESGRLRLEGGVLKETHGASSSARPD